MLVTLLESTGMDAAVTSAVTDKLKQELSKWATELGESNLTIPADGLQRFGQFFFLVRKKTC